MLPPVPKKNILNERNMGIGKKKKKIHQKKLKIAIVCQFWIGISLLLVYVYQSKIV